MWPSEPSLTSPFIVAVALTEKLRLLTYSSAHELVAVCVLVKSMLETDERDELPPHPLELLLLELDDEDDDELDVLIGVF